MKTATFNPDALEPPARTSSSTAAWPL